MAEKKQTKGEICLEKNGYTLTMKKNIKKSGVSSVEEYRVVRKERKKNQAKLRKAKKDRVRANKRAKDADKKTKKK